MNSLFRGKGVVHVELITSLDMLLLGIWRHNTGRFVCKQSSNIAEKLLQSLCHNIEMVTGDFSFRQYEI